MAVHVTDLHLLRDQLIERRHKLEAAVARSKTANLLQLLERRRGGVVPDVVALFVRRWGHGTSCRAERSAALSRWRKRPRAGNFARHRP